MGRHIREKPETEEQARLLRRGPYPLGQEERAESFQEALTEAIVMEEAMEEERPVPTKRRKRKEEGRTELGRFEKGWAPPPKKAGRPFEKDVVKPLLDAVINEFSITELRYMMRETYDMAKENKQWNGMFQVLQLVMNYAIGKPVQRSINATVNPEMLRDLITGGRTPFSAPAEADAKNKEGENEREHGQTIEAVATTDW